MSDATRSRPRAPGLRGPKRATSPDASSEPEATDVPTSPRATLRRLYRDISGYDIPREEERSVRMRRSSPTYGEITFGSVEKLIAYLDVGPRDVVYDLGSGVGKMILQVAMTTAARRCVGIELAPTRHASALAVLERIRQQGLITTGSCELICDDFMDRRLDDATVIYTCSTTFSDHLMRRLTRRLSTLQPGLRFITTRHPIVRHGFVPEAELRLDMSWHRRSPVYVYRLPDRRS